MRDSAFNAPRRDANCALRKAETQSPLAPSRTLSFSPDCRLHSRRTAAICVRRLRHLQILARNACLLLFKLRIIARTPWLAARREGENKLYTAEDFYSRGSVSRRRERSNDHRCTRGASRMIPRFRRVLPPPLAIARVRRVRVFGDPPPPRSSLKRAELEACLELFTQLTRSTRSAESARPPSAEGSEGGGGGG